MQFTHEAKVIVDGPSQSVVSDWSDVACLPQLLTHIRATARGDEADLARFVIVLDGSHIEFAAQRTMCDRDTVCWQSLGSDFDYVLTISAVPAEKGTEATVNCSYDPPGFLTELLETLGFGRTFQHQFESDLHRYAESFESQVVSRSSTDTAAPVPMPS